MVFILFALSLTLGGAGVYLWVNSPEQKGLAIGLMAGGILLFLLTILFYLTRKRRKRGKNDCLDCNYVDIPINCIDCDGKPDCDCDCNG
ncbi:hypothetical protein [Brevibacillus migulae]|uniref:hypothetical protein n=1 Tax=Brevibacillus migulae TaxID=1644114 RepID=UPI00106E3822|nr:hypothetical protein [Brevibacillus migulae]